MKLRDADIRIIDISQEIRYDMTVYPGDPSFSSHLVSSFKKGDICEVSELTIGSHCGYSSGRSAAYDSRRRAD